MTFSNINKHQCSNHWIIHSHKYPAPIGLKVPALIFCLLKEGCLHCALSKEPAIKRLLSQRLQQDMQISVIRCLT